MILKFFFQGQMASGKTAVTTLFSAHYVYRFNAFTEDSLTIEKRVDAITEGAMAGLVPLLEVVFIIDAFHHSDKKLQDFVLERVQSLPFKALVILSQAPAPKGFENFGQAKFQYTPPPKKEPGRSRSSRS